MEAASLKKGKDYFTNFKCNRNIFYGLLKVHMSETIINAWKSNTIVYINIPTPELRSIIADSACETHRLRNFIDILLKPLLKHIKSHIREDLDILVHPPETISETKLLVPFDVIKLYNKTLMITETSQ